VPKQPLIVGNPVLVVVDSRARGGVGDEQGVAQRLCSGAVGDLGERDQQPTGVPPGTFDRQRPVVGRVGLEHGAGSEAQLR